MVNENILKLYRFARAVSPSLTASYALERAYKNDEAGNKAKTYYAPSIGTPNMGGMRWVSDWSAYFRDMKYCDDVVRSIGHDGWYSDSYQDATYRGAVFQLRGRNGKTQWLAGYVDSDNDAARVDFSEVFEWDAGDDAPDDAARRADRLAESAAEDSREYNMAWQSGSMWREVMDHLPNIRTELRLPIQAYRATAPGKARDVVMSAIRDQLRERADAFKRADILAAGDDEAYCFWTGDKKLCAAFNEGAGKKVLS